MRQDGCAEFISTSLRIVPQKKTPVWASFLISAAPAEAGGSPLCRTPAGGGESVHIFRGRKRVLVLGKVRADGALTRRVSAAGCCTAQSASVPCAFRDAVGCFGHCVLHGEVWWRSLPPAPRSSALWHGPPMPRRGAGVVFEFSSQGVSIPWFGLCVRTHTEGACSLFVHLHLNREWNPCPCRSSRHLNHLPYFPSSASMISVREVPSQPKMRSMRRRSALSSPRVGIVIGSCSV